MMPKYRRGPWSQAEDNHLLQLVHEQGAHNWVRISHLIQSRSPKQCRERFHQNLKPSLNLEPITPAEGVLIEKLVAEMGKRWAEIARRLRGRSDNAVKNWWNGGMNRRKRLDFRKAEMAPRHAHTHQIHTEARHDSGPVRHMNHDAVLSSSLPVEPRHDPAQVHPQHMHHSPQTLVRPSYQPVQRRAVEPSAPSPSAISCISRADSTEGGPPSLISDYSLASHSTSPHGSPPVHGLPPLSEMHGDSRRYSHSLAGIHHAGPSPLHYESEARGWAHHPPKPDWSHTQQAIQQLNQNWSSYVAKAPMPSPRNPPPAGPQLALPNFKTITAPEPSAPPAPPSPPKDSRMDLSNVIH